MNAYDFDGTIYRGNSSVDFILWLLRRHPRLIGYVPAMVLAAIGHAIGRTSTEDFKSAFFRPVADVDAGLEAELFWTKAIRKTSPWYKPKKTDVVVSASPEFLLEPACRLLGIRPPIATRMDPSTGRVLGRNCKGTEKTVRFRERYPSTRLRHFFSDSESDRPMAELADRAWLVKRGKPRAWRT